MAVKANEILSYSGDSALAGGLGAAGASQTIQGVWQMTNAINQSVAMMKAQEFKKNQNEYEQKIKDRDKVSELLSSGALVTDEMEDADRLKVRDEVDVLKKGFIEAAKKGITDESYISIRTKIGELTQRANNAKTNYLTIKADEKMNNELYDPNSSTKQVSKSVVDPNNPNETITTTTQSKDENVRRTSENQAAWEAHIAKEREAMKNDPNHKYKPFVPLSRINYDNAYPVEFKTIRKDLGNGKYEESSVADFDKTANVIMANWSDPNKRKDIQKAYDQMVEGALTGEVAGVTAITQANKKIQEINAAQGRTVPVSEATVDTPQDKIMYPTIDKSTNPPTAMAIVSFTKAAESAPQPVVRYKTKNDEKLEAEINTTNQNIRQAKVVSKIQTDDNIRQARAVENIKKEFAGTDKPKVSDMIKLYEIEAEALDKSIDPITATPEQKKAIEKEKSKLRNTYLNFGFKEVQKQAESGGDPNAVSSAGAIGLFQIMPDTGRQYFKTLFPELKFNEELLKDPKINEQIRDVMMSDLLKKYNGQPVQAYAAYNWGQGNLDRLIRKYPRDWTSRLPKETITYVSRVLGEDNAGSQTQTKEFTTIQGKSGKTLKIVK